MAKRAQSRPSGKLPKIKQNFGLLPEDIQFLEEVAKKRRITDPFTASKSAILHDALNLLRRHMGADHHPPRASAAA